MPCTGEQGDLMCTCDGGLKYAEFVIQITPEEEMPLLYGRRQISTTMALWCGRANSCLYEQEAASEFPAISDLHACLDLETFESYEATWDFPEDGDSTSEERSWLYCRDYTFHCAGN